MDKQVKKKKVTAQYGLYAYPDDSFENPIVLVRNANVTIIEENSCLMNKEGKTYKMDLISYKRKKYLCANEFLK